MASQLTEVHRRAQLRLGAVTVARMLAAFQLLDPDDLDGTFEEWLTVVTPIVDAARATSTRLASGYLSMIRAAELGPDPKFAAELADPLNTEAFTTSMLVTGPISIRANLARNMSLAKAVDIASAYTAGAGMRHALNGGRETITATVRADKRAVGYQRVTSGNACAYCASKAGTTFADDHVFEAHDRCGCTAEPVYR